MDANEAFDLWARQCFDAEEEEAVIQRANFLAAFLNQVLPSRPPEIILEKASGVAALIIGANDRYSKIGLSILWNAFKPHCVRSATSLNRKDLLPIFGKEAVSLTMEDVTRLSEKQKLSDAEGLSVALRDGIKILEKLGAFGKSKAISADTFKAQASEYPSNIFKPSRTAKHKQFIDLHIKHDGALWWLE